MSCYKSLLATHNFAIKKGQLLLPERYKLLSFPGYNLIWSASSIYQAAHFPPASNDKCPQLTQKMYEYYFIFSHKHYDYYIILLQLID